MGNIFKLKAWVRYDGKGRLVGGGPILQESKPKNGDWVEIDSLICCAPNPSSTTTGNKLKAFVRYANGKVVAGSMVMQAKKPAVGKWEEVAMYNNCCVTPSGPFNLQQFFSRINTCYGQVTSLIPNIVYFSDNSDGNGITSISDGCDGMYDGGNLYNTNLTQLYADIEQNNVDFELSIPYTHTQDPDGYCPYEVPSIDGTINDGSSYFGAGSQYFTNMYPGMFILAANGVNVSEFSITGDLGSDGQGIDTVYIATAHLGWTAFIKTNDDSSGTGDPSVNHIILVYGDVSGATQLYDDTGTYDDHCVQGLGSQNSAIITAIVSTEATTPALTQEEALAIANQILNVYNDTECTPPPALKLLFSDINFVNSVIGDAANGDDWNSYFDLPTYGNQFTSAMVVGNEVRLFGGSNIIIKEMLFDQADELGTYLLSVNDELGCVIEVEYDAFGNDNNSGCPNLLIVNFPEVTSIGNGSFSGCTTLTTINFPNTITIDNGCFLTCISLTSVNLPKLTTAKNSSFAYCSSLTSINLPKLTAFEDACFYSCSSLNIVNLPELITAGDQSFINCIAITTVNLPVCTTLGSTVENNYIFNAISGNTITLTIPSALMTCNSGNPDGDIQLLQSNNTVTIITV